MLEFLIAIGKHSDTELFHLGHYLPLLLDSGPAEGEPLEVFATVR